MIEAAIKNKIPEIKNQEDCLTSTIWGILKYQPLRTLLANFIARADLYADNSIHFGSTILSNTRFMTDAINIEFWQHHPTHGEPDIIIIGHDFVFVIEVKYYASLSGKDQLKRYYELIKSKYSNKPHKHVIYLTRDLTCPALDKEATAGIEDSLWWLSWYDLYETILKSSNDSVIIKELCQDMVRFLTYYGLNSFQGITTPQILTLKNFFWNDSIPIITEYEAMNKISEFFWLEGTL